MFSLTSAYNNAIESAILKSVSSEDILINEKYTLNENNIVKIINLESASTSYFLKKNETGPHNLMVYGIVSFYYKRTQFKFVLQA